MRHISHLKVLLAGDLVGDLGVDARGLIYFQYAVEWLKNGFDLSPDTLAFQAAPQLSLEPQEFGSLHGVFYDSLPDGWGLLLMDRAFRELTGWQTHEITPLDRLAYIGSRAMGALEYQPEIFKEEIANTVDIAQLAHSAEQILQGGTPEVLQQLQIQGGSPGGARPKVTVALSEESDECLSGFQTLPQGFTHWIVKFRAREDLADLGRIELAYARMAVLAGLIMPETHLISVQRGKKTESFFAVKRFDREGNKRLHTLSLSAYIYANHRLPSVSYETVLNATRNITRSMEEVRKVFRLMVFNVLAHNKDDHAKNFAFIRPEHDWELSPAFDLTFSSGLNNQHTTDIAGSGNPTLRHVQQVAEKCGVKDWREIVEEVRAATNQWEIIAKALDVSKSNIKKIGKVLMEVSQRL
ncbi:type II toxin-antitoxin system HipA family toxin [uncultured Thiothrix sp.]|uniref:type II toxin-antitoxin system HipA family toxin n=1 Tax=uncultured Thiothrix sp. TaxID=223185 RepID=UPI0026279209|nr:type II toxin-antitoxin system HipA family toxin [uncultured Thiothrix sp.]HMT94233.1 type II toxin-antitoxin system HipA family toxin [Thiolinea sp.]